MRRFVTLSTATLIAAAVFAMTGPASIAGMIWGL